MNKIRLILTVGVMLYALPVHSANEAYEMVCRGGQGMVAYFNVKKGGGYNLKIHFSKARSSANSRSPREGSCAWLDRPIKANEPARMVRHRDRPVLSETEIEIRDGKVVSIIPRNHQGKARKELTYLLPKIMNGGEFRVKVRQDFNTGYFVVQSIYLR